MTATSREPGKAKPDRREALRRIAAGVAGIVLARTAPGRAQVPREAPMLTRPIPATGERLPVIGIGTWQTFDVGRNASARSELREVLNALVQGGGTVVDSSPMYGSSEEVVGDLAAELQLRPRLFVATKVWTSGRQNGIDQMNASMRKLRADPIDLMQVHNLVDAGIHLETLRAWKREGRVRYIGVTHYTASSYDAVAAVLRRGPIDFVQINYSIGERDAERNLLPLAAERGVAVIANRPFAGGDLFRRLRARPLPDYAGEIGCTSWAQLMLKFIISHRAITCAIPGTSKVEHLRDNLKAGEGVLPDERMRERIAAEA
jgi:aryl-alcohol dehydrogenase-like predicted oxidoreductase